MRERPQGTIGYRCRFEVPLPPRPSPKRSTISDYAASSFLIQASPSSHMWRIPQIGQRALISRLGNSSKLLASVLMGVGALRPVAGHLIQIIPTPSPP
jgi:hypothetical protein